jgi:NADH-quinone oxidoreductase subunit E
MSVPTRIDASTYAELREIAGRYPRQRSALLPMLHLVQSVDGHVTPSGIEACANVLGLTAAEVSAVATFYTMYKRRPLGDYHVGVCTNTLCAVLGGDVIFERLQEHLGIGNDETTEDGAITLEHIECNAACDYAPVVMVNWEFFDNQTPESAMRLVDDLRARRPVTATRGATVGTWRDAERVLAGFPDGKADEGPAAGPPTLEGLRLARERQWQAPPADGARTPDQPAGDQPGSDRPDSDRPDSDLPAAGRADGASAAAAEETGPGRAEASRAESEATVAESSADVKQGPGDAADPAPTSGWAPEGDDDEGAR